MNADQSLMYSLDVTVATVNSTHVETVVTLRGVKVDSHVSIDLDVDRLGLQSNKTTYDQIKAYVKDKYGFSVSSIYIAQVKDRAGIEKRENYNIGEGKSLVPVCPPEKDMS